MSKIRIISISILFLLLVGSNIHAKTVADSDVLTQKLDDKDSSKKESRDQESKETISQLDFYGAFSLVNVQLQWRDFPLGLTDQETNAESSVNQKELSLEEVETLSNEVEDQILPTSLIINNANAVVPVSAYRTVDGRASFICTQSTQRTSTIAYILNCGTYPVSC